MSLLWYMLVMALVTYVIRMVPFTVFRKKITSRFVRSLLYYLPYAVLSAMTFPAIFYATGNTLTAVVGTVVALALAYLRLPLVVVALAAAAGALVTNLLMII